MESDGEGIPPLASSPTACEPEMAPQINEVQQIQQPSEGVQVDRALTDTTSSEIVNAAPDISMVSNLDLDGREQFGPNPAEVVLENSPDIVELISRKGKQNMIDWGDDTNAHTYW